MYKGLLFRAANLTCHMLLLSIMEYFFFFHYAAVAETKHHMSEMKHFDDLLNQFVGTIDTDSFQAFLQTQSILATRAKKQRQLDNEALRDKCKFTIMCVLIVFIVFAFIGAGTIHWTTLIFDNILITIGILIYEYKFYTNVASQFQPSSPNEDLYRFALNMKTKINSE